MQSPWMNRARQKPLGYPGDYELMTRVYDNHFAGATLFAKAVDLSFALTPAAVAVRARKDMLRERLSRLIDERKGKPVRILSIAAGPRARDFRAVGSTREPAESRRDRAFRPGQARAIVLVRAAFAPGPDAVP